MKNTIIISAIDHCNCDLVSNVNDGTNRVFLEIHSDMNSNPILNIGDSAVTITGSPFVYEIPSNLLTGSGQIIFNIVDNSHTGDNFYINQTSELGGELYLQQIDNFNYSLVCDTKEPDVVTEVQLNDAKNEVLKSANNYTDTKLKSYALTGHTHNYLPLSGGTLTGILNANGGILINGYNLLLTELANDFWGLATPDGDSSTWIRTTENGIIPYKSGASSSIGTSTWRFNYGYFNTLDVNAIIYARNNINITNYGTGITWNTTYGITGINNLSSGDGIYLYNVNSGSSGWSSAIMIANKDGVNLVPKTGGTFTGDVGVAGTLTVGSRLLVNGSKIQSTSTYNSTTSASANLVISSAGWFNRSTASSRRYKRDIVDISDDLNPEKLLSVPIRQYKFNEDYLSKDDQRYNVDVPGFIAEELYEHYPIAVEVNNGVVEDWNHRMLIPPMLSLIQKLYKRIDELERKMLI